MQSANDEKLRWFLQMCKNRRSFFISGERQIEGGGEALGRLVLKIDAAVVGGEDLADEDETEAVGGEFLRQGGAQALEDIIVQAGAIVGDGDEAEAALDSQREGDRQWIGRVGEAVAQEIADGAAEKGGIAGELQGF